MTEQPDIDHVTYVSPADYDRINAALDEPPEPNERTRATAKQLRQERPGYTSWAELRPRVVTSEQRVAEVRAELEQARATPDRDGYTIGVFLPPGVSEAVRDQLADQIMDLVQQAVHGAEIVGQAGDPLGAVDGVARP